MTIPQTSNVHELEDAFRLFAETSRQMEAAYRELEGRVAELNRELTIARSERFRQLQEKESLANRLQHLLAALPGGVMVLDATGTIIEANPAAHQLLDQPPEGAKWSEICQRSISPGHGQEVVLTNERVVTIAISSLGSQPGQIVLIHDVTETQHLKELMARQRRLVSMGEMAAQLAHQIRTPLASALLYLSLLRQHELDRERRASTVEKAYFCLQELENQINDMLLFARSGQVELEPVDLAELGHRLTKTLEPQLGDCRLDVTELRGTLRGSRDALLAALTNLVSNARDVGATRIAVASNSGATRLTLIVEDDGPGVDPAIRDKIFDPFFTARSRGTGLGFAAVRTVVEAHGGSVELVDEPGRGACFRLSFPHHPFPDFLPSGKELDTSSRRDDEPPLWRYS